MERSRRGAVYAWGPCLHWFSWGMGVKKRLDCSHNHATSPSCPTPPIIRLHLCMGGCSLLSLVLKGHSSSCCTISVLLYSAGKWSHTQHIRSTYAACTQHICSMYAAHTQHIRSMHAACTQHARSTYAACTQYVRSTYTSHTQLLRMHYIRSTYAARMEHIHSMYAAHTQQVRSTYVA